MINVNTTLFVIMIQELKSRHDFPVFVIIIRMKDNFPVSVVITMIQNLNQWKCYLEWREFQ